MMIFCPTARPDQRCHGGGSERPKVLMTLRETEGQPWEQQRWQQW